MLTSDRGSFSEYSRSTALGYFCCLPSRLVPRLLMDHLFAPPVPHAPDGTPRAAPYALRKVEAALHARGITDVAVVPPEGLGRAVGHRTRVVGLTAHDPFGLSPVTTKLTMLFGGGASWNETFFHEIGREVAGLRSRYGFRVVVGGPGIWQMSYRRPEWVDTVFQGEAEVDFPALVGSILSGGTPPAIVHGQPPRLEEIPTILHPSRFGEIQVTRGCPRGCEFCSITPEKYRSFPYETIEREIAVNRAAGEENVEIITDDVLLYGAQRLRTNHEAVVELFRRIARTGARQIGFAHVSAPAVRESPQTVLEMGHIAGWDRTRGLTPVVGLETGSTRVFRKYMPAKAFPFRPEEWKDVILDATDIMNRAGIDPCYTMTIGFPDETDADVGESIRMVEAIVDQGYRAFVFPLPVIPITTSRIAGNPMPHLETLPERYWDLLDLCWTHDLRLARAMLPSLIGRMRSPIARRTTTYFVERIAPHVTKFFDEFRATRGRSAYRFRAIELEGVGGVLRSALWLAEATVHGPDVSAS
ncbi:MAG: radical SAM protein [Thermoplasmata archaeon]